MSRNIKKRHWAFVLYPDSAPDQWIDMLVNTGIQFCVSPLHDRDVNPDGSFKKPHFHVILVYDGPTTYNNVKSLTDSLGQPIPQPLEQVRGYYRYLTHKDNPEKFQYNEFDIHRYNGFDIKDFADLTYGEVQRCLKSIQTFIVDNCLIEFSDLMDFLLSNDYYDLYDVASSHSFFINCYITSYRNKMKKYS